MTRYLLYLMVLLYAIAGIVHFVKPGTYLRIMPPYIPWPLTMVYLSGVCEIVFGLLLLPEVTRPMAAWLIIALLVAVFPANIQMAVIFYRKENPYLWLAIARLPLQGLLIWWAWVYTRQVTGG